MSPCFPSATRTWYATDALGSVRATLTNLGQPVGALRYDPWGAPQGSAIAPFGFTGEVQQGSNVYLRARWYNASSGSFGSKDPFAGFSEQPYSLHPYQYAYAAPTTWTDPTGQCSREGDDYCFPDHTLLHNGVADGPTIRLPQLPETPQLPSKPPLDGPGIGGGIGTLIGRTCFFLGALLLLQGDSPYNPVPLPEIPDGESIQVVIYRGLDGDPSKDKTYFKKPITSPSQFRLDPDGVSTFELHDLPSNKPYAAPFFVAIRRGYKAGDKGLIVGSHVYNGNHCIATYSPELGDNKDHWSVSCTPREDTPKILQYYILQDKDSIIANPNWYGSANDRLPRPE